MSNKSMKLADIIIEEDKSKKESADKLSVLNDSAEHSIFALLKLPELDQKRDKVK